MKKVIFYDEINDGHHWFYNYNLLKSLTKSDVCYFTSFNAEDEEKIRLLNKNNIKFHNNYIYKPRNRFLRLLVNLININKVFSFLKTNKYEQIHFLYLDNIIFHVFLNRFFYRNLSITATLHWLPKQRIKYNILRFMLKYKYVEKLIVHGDYIKDKLINSLGSEYSDKVISANYPVMGTTKNFDKIYMDETIGISKYNKPFLLYFGGTRYDKGLDFLLEAIKLLKCNSFTLLVVGEEQYFKCNFIEDKIRDVRDKVYLKLEYVPEEQVEYYFEKADVVILPYRKIFSGQSGPLTEAANHHCVVVGADVGQVGYTIKTYGLGYVFEPEDVVSLAKTLDSTIENLNDSKQLFYENQKTYKNICSFDSFVKSYKMFLN